MTTTFTQLSLFEQADSTLLEDIKIVPDFSGDTYKREHDHARLTGQMLRIFELMKDGNWRTLTEIEQITKAPSASVSAQLRNMKKEKFGGHGLEKRPRGDRDGGLWEYRLIVS